MDTLLADVRFALRVLARHWTFTAIAAVTLALGIGANTAVFSLVNAVLLKPLPYADADRLVVLWERRFADDRPTNVVSPANFLRWQERSQAFSEMAAIADARATLTGAGEPEDLPGQAVNANLFPMLGVKAALGRTFLQEEDRQGHHHVVILSDNLWRRRFNADPAVVGRAIALAGESYTVVGVMPPGFSILSVASDYWMPMAFSAEARTPRGRYLRAVGRLREGMTVEAAQAELDTVAAGLRAEFPDFNTGWGVRLVPLNDQVFGDIRPVLFVLFGAVGFVLLLACVNVANLALNRGLAREQELALRSALGAGRGRIIRQLLTEGVVLAAIGGSLAVLLAWWSLRGLLPAATQLLSLPRRIDEIGLDAPVLAFALLASLGTVLVFALLPALTLSRVPLDGALREGARAGQENRTQRRLRRALVVVQLALAFTLLVGAGLMVRTVGRLLALDAGFRPDHVLTMRVLLPQSRYAAPEQVVGFFDRLLEEIARLPGVVSAGVSSGMPFRGFPIGTTFSVEGRPFPGEANLPVADIRIVGGRYFESLRIPLLQGRLFEPRDGEPGRGAAIVNDRLRRQLFPGQNPLGQRINVRLGRGDAGQEAQIVGVVADVKYASLDTDVRPMIYLTNRQMAFPWMGIVIRTSGEAEAVAPLAISQVRQLDPDLPVSEVATMDQVVGESIAQRRFVMVLLGVFGGLALALAAVGVYGVLAYSMSRRVPEIGVRLALGAGPGELVRHFLKDSVALTAIGLMAGLALAVPVSRLLGRLLYGVTPLDPLTILSAALTLAVVASLAAYVPVRRASRTDPVKALRAD
ncbi:MAG TPA: ABC transporter permease [Vicinamibacterales bacterium]|nr:ABC transporter permease [Vicinamibacterales bacterium]